MYISRRAKIRSSEKFCFAVPFYPLFFFSFFFCCVTLVLFFFPDLQISELRHDRIAIECVVFQIFKKKRGGRRGGARSCSYLEKKREEKKACGTVRCLHVKAILLFRYSCFFFFSLLLLPFLSCSTLPSECAVVSLNFCSTPLSLPCLSTRLGIDFSHLGVTEEKGLSGWHARCGRATPARSRVASPLRPRCRSEDGEGGRRTWA